MSEEPTPKDTAINEIVSQWRDDHVIVDRVLGNGNTEELDSALTELANQVDYPVYVALVDTVPGLRESNPSGELVTLLHNEVGEDGLYVVATSDGPTSTEAFGIEEWDPEPSYAAIRDIRDQTDFESGRLSTGGDAALSLMAAAEPGESINTAEVLDSPLYREPPFRDDLGAGPWGPLSAAIAFAIVGASVPLVVRWATEKVTPAPRPHTRSVPQRFQLAEVGKLRRRADRALTELESKRTELADAGAAYPRGMDDAIASVRRLSSSQTRFDLIGAAVIAQQGLALADGDEYRTCFYNPLHGAGTTSVNNPDFAGTLSVCANCAKSPDPTSLKTVLTGNDGAGQRPYYEANDVWARTGFGSLSARLWEDLR